MRAAIPLLAACAVLAACSNGPRQANAAAPPSVSYQVTGNDVSQANERARNYCAQYGRAAQYQGVRTTSSGNVAVYNCSGAATESGVGSGSTVAPTAQCADLLHQNRPGGSDYKGPPVPGCPPSR